MVRRLRTDRTRVPPRWVVAAGPFAVGQGRVRRETDGGVAPCSVDETVQESGEQDRLFLLPYLAERAGPARRVRRGP